MAMDFVFSIIYLKILIIKSINKLLKNKLTYKWIKLKIRKNMLIKIINYKD